MRGYARVLDSDGVEGFETVNNAQIGASFLQDGKPSRSIGRVRSLIDTSVDFGLNDFADILVDTWRDGHISKYPGFVFDNGHEYWREEVFVESTSLGIVPGKSLVLDAHEMMHELALLWPKEVTRVDSIYDGTVLCGISTGGDERRGIGG